MVEETTITSTPAKNVPGLVKFLSILYYIGAGMGLIFGAIFIFGSEYLGAIVEQLPFFVFSGTSIFIITGAMMIAFAILNFFIGRGLWKGSNWARIVVIIFSIIWFILGIGMIFFGEVLSALLNIIINGLVGGYLLFSKSVKEAFSKVQ